MPNSRRENQQAEKWIRITQWWNEEENSWERWAYQGWKSNSQAAIRVTSWIIEWDRLDKAENEEVREGVEWHNKLEGW
jgi:hypothetical protein